MNIFLKNRLVKLLLEEKVGRKALLLEVEKIEKESLKRDAGYIEYLERDMGISVIAYDEAQYPKKLKQISDFPILLFVKGRKELLTEDIFTVVGTRKMTRYGYNVVEQLLKDCKNFCIASGLANGVDAKVHSTCLKNNIPTIAVVAGGFFEGFPRSNINLFEEICEEGLVISEFPPGRRLIKGMFPMRNRILAGMSSGVLVIESGVNGGSMITANLALEYGREVLAVPGNIFSEGSMGCNLLISQGAEIVTDKEEFNTLLNDCIHN